MNIALMPDALHPSVEGSRLKFGECIREEVAKVAGGRHADDEDERRRLDLG